MPAAELRAAIDEVAARLEGVERRDAGGATEYLRHGRPFAALTVTGLEVSLDDAVARAALRTTDTRASLARPGWVAFGPPTSDRYALDRATAWFEAAWRRAGRRARLS